VTFRLFSELIGDKYVKEYSRADAGDFLDLLKKMPASHGKTRHATARQYIADASEQISDGKKYALLSMKTIKRHFSALTVYWKWLETRGHVDCNIFTRFEFPGTKSSKARRDIWPIGDIEKLLRAEWFIKNKKSAFFWLPLISMYSGMQLEEISRLRPDYDICEIDGIWTFILQGHPDGWSPKSEAGERFVPVHSLLIRLGFIDFVRSRRKMKVERLFADLVPGGPDGKFGFNFSRIFSKFKIALGVGSKVTFHSFRHNVRNHLESEPLEERWIDDVLGHERPSASEGGGLCL
jgi:integrase